MQELTWCCYLTRSYEAHCEKCWNWPASSQMYLLDRMSVNIRHFKVITSAQLSSQILLFPRFVYTCQTDDRVVREKIQCHSVQAEGWWRRDPRDQANTDKCNETNKPVVKVARQIIHLVPCKMQNYWCACQILQSWYSGWRNYQLPYPT